MTLLLLRQTATFSRLTRSADGQGGWVESYAPVATGVRCHLAMAGRNEEQVVETEREKVPRRLHVVGFVPERDDRALLDTGELVEVRSVERPGGVPFTLEEHVECDVVEVQRGR